MDVIKTVAVNRKARRDYEILERFEAGIVLEGCEVKSIREGGVNFKDSYVDFTDSMEAWLRGLHISPYRNAGTHKPYDPERDRKLLLHKRELKRLHGRVAQKGLTVIPLSIYFRGDKVKVEIALARGRKLYDKRAEIARREHEREVERRMRERMRRG